MALLIKPTPARPVENGYIESFDGKFREDLLNGALFLELNDARQTLEVGRDLMGTGPTARAGT